MNVTYVGRLRSLRDANSSRRIKIWSGVPLCGLNPPCASEIVRELRKMGEPIVEDKTKQFTYHRHEGDRSVVGGIQTGPLLVQRKDHTTSPTFWPHLIVKHEVEEKDDSVDHTVFWFQLVCVDSVSCCLEDISENAVLTSRFAQLEFANGLEDFISGNRSIELWLMYTNSTQSFQMDLYLQLVVVIVPTFLGAGEAGGRNVGAKVPPGSQDLNRVGESISLFVGDHRWGELSHVD